MPKGPDHSFPWPRSALRGSLAITERILDALVDGGLGFVLRRAGRINTDHLRSRLSGPAAKNG
jgi:hypothetical protein